ncbi:MAG: SRPBCC family protein [Ignavibacteriae bacterium]|nr:SRPBCC family protein [Ignavibacteriota bacterium]
MFIFEKSVIINCSIDKVFDFHSDVDNLVKLSEYGSMKVRIVSVNLPLNKGSEILLSVKQFGILKISWLLQIEKFERPYLFSDTQLKGPFKKWKHEHRFESIGDSTKNTDRIEYEMPFGFLGKIAHSLFVRKRIEKLFEFRHKLVKELLEE